MLAGHTQTRSTTRQIGLLAEGTDQIIWRRRLAPFGAPIMLDYTVRLHNMPGDVLVVVIGQLPLAHLLRPLRRTRLPILLISSAPTAALEVSQLLHGPVLISDLQTSYTHLARQLTMLCTMTHGRVHYQSTVEV